MGLASSVSRPVCLASHTCDSMNVHDFVSPAAASSSTSFFLFSTEMPTHVAACALSLPRARLVVSNAEPNATVSVSVCSVSAMFTAETAKSCSDNSAMTFKVRPG